MLSTLSGFDSSARGRGGATEDDGGAQRLEGVLSVARKVRSCSEASCAALEGNADFGLQSELLGFSRECGSLGGLGVALEVRGGSVRVERRLDWGGMGSGVWWLVLVFLG